MLLAAGFQYVRAQDKTPDKAPDKAAAPRTLQLKIHYTGSGTVDDKHKILVFLFDTPEFVQGTVIPFAQQSVSAKEGSLTFSDIAKSPVYIAAVFDPTGGYDGQSGPPPSGSSLGIYTTAPPAPAGVNIEEGKTASVELTFDDTAKMP